MTKYEKLEHHAYLTIDEPAKLKVLFDKDVEKLVIDLRGRTTVSKSKSRINALGIKKLNHTYLEVRKDGLEVKSTKDLEAILDQYTNEGITNLYMVRLIVSWKNGDMQEWHRHVLLTKDKETDRIIPSGRRNTLTVKLGLFQEADRLQKLYGSELVQPTACEIIQQEHTEKRVCLITMAKGVKAEA
jgi:hypothetical protein